MIPGLWELIDYTVNTLGQKNTTVIWTNQNAARIDKPYIALSYINNDLPDNEWIDDRNVDENGNREIASWRKATADLQFYCGPDSMQTATLVSMLLATDAALSKQNELNVSIGTRLFLQRIPAMLNTSQWEDRAIYQFDFYYTATIEEFVSWIETVVVTGEYEGSLTEITCTETITVTYPSGLNNGAHIGELKSHLKDKGVL